MCLMVWLGSANPLVGVSPPEVSEAPLGELYVKPEPADAPVRVQFVQPYVYYVGSHQGCGCGFRSPQLELEGFELVAEVLPLLSALLDDERSDFLDEQRSRELLSALVRSALCEGDVEVFSCWAGDEGKAPTVAKDVSPDYFAAHLNPLDEGAKYRIHRE